MYYEKEISCIPQIYFCLVVEVEFKLSASLSENNFCKIDVISAKTQCNITEKKYGFSHEYFCHTAFAKLRLRTFFSENNF